LRRLQLPREARKFAKRKLARPARDAARSARSAAESTRGQVRRFRRLPEALPRNPAALLAIAPAAVYALGRAQASRRPPIQRSIDIAAPLAFVYDQWVELESLPEGARTVTDIERHGDNELSGRIGGGLRSRKWQAEILDEREGESFAWRSTAGSDCAGLITFHRLGERLTRIELQLDVVPVSPRETVALALGIADRRAESELRRFKSRLETVSPDAYEEAPEPGIERTHDDKEK
jgi:uncharacterized membrane protein